MLDSFNFDEYIELDDVYGFSVWHLAVGLWAVSRRALRIGVVGSSYFFRIPFLSIHS